MLNIFLLVGNAVSNAAQYHPHPDRSNVSASMESVWHWDNLHSFRWKSLLPPSICSNGLVWFGKKSSASE